MPAKPGCQGSGVLPEAAQMLCPDRVDVAVLEGDDGEEFVQATKGDQILQMTKLDWVEAGLQIYRRDTIC
jgi:hypothetical protein